jgi:hypothetical protein
MSPKQGGVIPSEVSGAFGFARSAGTRVEESLYGVKCGNYKKLAAALILFGE